jgi:hypothetical protein
MLYDETSVLTWLSNLYIPKTPKGKILIGMLTYPPVSLKTLESDHVTPFEYDYLDIGDYYYAVEQIRYLQGM